MTEQGQMWVVTLTSVSPTCKAHTCISALSLYRRSFQTHLVLQYTDLNFPLGGNTGIGPVLLGGGGSGG